MTAYNLREKLKQGGLASRQKLLDTGSGSTIIVDRQLAVLDISTTGARTLQAAAQVELGALVLVCATVSGVTVNSVSVEDGQFTLFAVTKDSSDANQWVVVSSTQIVNQFIGTQTEQIALNNEWRVWDALITNLAGADGTDDLGLVTGTYLTTGPTFNVTVATPTAAPFYARRLFNVPKNYNAGTDLTFRVTVTEAVAATTASVDLNIVRQAAPTVDVVATALQSIIGASGTVYSFTVTGTNIVPGEVLDLRLVITLDDGAATPNYSVNKVDYTYSAG